MMDVTNISPQLDRLDNEIDNLEEALQPLLGVGGGSGSLSELASKLPLLDKAKLYVLITYAIESMLFSSLRLNGVNAKEHPVFKELTRVRQYFTKIKDIETPPSKPEQSINKEAAIRFIRSDLADDKEVNAKLSEMIAKEKAKAALKSAQAAGKRKADESGSSSESDEEDSGAKEVTAEPSAKPSKGSKKDEKDKKVRRQKKSKRAKKT